MHKSTLSLDDLRLDAHVVDEDPIIKEISTKEIAVIGMAVKFPMADNLDEYWTIIENGLDCVCNLPKERKQDTDRYLEFIRKIDGVEYLKKAYIDDIDKFDYDFFHMSPKEASLMNPIQRLFLQVAWSSLEDAGYGGKRIVGSNTGVYLGLISDLEGYKYKEMIHEVDPFLLPISTAGNLASMTASRIAYILNLKGPSMLVDTACSSSLVAVDLACKALRDGTCEMAIAGGARIGIFPIDKDYYKIGIESSDSMTRTFDDNSDGSGLGEGVAAVLLKPLNKAIRDNDSIYAVIKGSMTNQDGTSMGITAPNPQSQVDLLTEVWENAGIHPDTLQYIEAHGTGTKLGDTIEIEAIKKAFKKYTDKMQFCAISSIKTNIGHIYEGSGVAGFIKAILALKNKKIPPSINFNKVNSKIDFEDSPVYVNTKLRDWDVKDQPRRCGVSSFGISGTNCHVILEEVPDNYKLSKCEKTQIFTISAQNKVSLYDMINNLKDYIKSKEFSLSDVCYSLNIGRGQYRYRVAFTVDCIENLISKLEKLGKVDLDDAKRIGVFYGEHKVVPEGKELKEKNELTEILKRELNIRAEELLKDYNFVNSSDEEIKTEICRLYVKGADIDWDIFYIGKRYSKVNLPSYKFAKKRCWIEIPQFLKEEIKDSEKCMFYSIGWKTENLEATAVKTTDDAILIFLDDKGIGSEIANMYRNKGLKILEVQFGNDYSKLDGKQISISGAEEDYTKLAMEIKQMNISKIIHLASLNERSEVSAVEEFDQRNEKGIFSLYHLSKALINCAIDRVIDVVMVSDYVCEVDGTEDRIKPENSILFGFGKVLRKEHSNISCRCIDIDDSTKAADILDELDTLTNCYRIAYRKGNRYIEEFKEVALEEKRERKLELKRDGIYLITGGTGGIGLEVAKFLGSKEKVNIALLSRTGLPKKDEWVDLLADDKDENNIKKINCIKEIESMGTSVKCCSVDVSDLEAMKKVLNDLRKEFGKINGIIHGAGVAVSEVIVNKKLKDLNCVIRPKVHGTWILDQLTLKDELDFFVLFSSIATIFDAPGQADYVAANSYLDAYSDYRNKNGKRTVAVNWSTWKETGMAARSGLGRDTLFKGMKNEMAITCFEEVLSREINKVLIGEINYKGEMIYLLEKNLFDLSPTIKERLNNRSRKVERKKVAKQSSGNVKLLGKHGEKYTEIELTIARICRETLGYEEINIYDSFFEMGADSILIKQMYTRLEEYYPGKVAIADIFEYSSILKLSKYIADKDTDNEVLYENKNVNENIQDDVFSMLDEMEKGGMTLDEVLSKMEEL
ncbi:MAG: SDR family NAD(P)-dependent oxidoreductase [Halanaerobiales bacterium]|nr:SDR family NAD(P)-dependent oxidoreductase [Halanaerobiales bacterium]